MRRKMQLAPMHDLMEAQRLGSLDKLYSDINGFITRGRNAALSLSTSSHTGASLSETDVPRREIAHAFYAVTGVVSSLHDLWTLTDALSIDKIEISIVSNSLRSCSRVLDDIDATMKLDNERLPGKSPDRGQHRGLRTFTAEEKAEAKRVLYACFHTITEAVKHAKTRRRNKDILCTDETPERLRLKEVLEHPYFHSPPSWLDGKGTNSNSTNTPPPCNRCLPFQPLLGNVPPRFLHTTQLRPSSLHTEYDFCGHQTYDNMADEPQMHDAAQSPNAVKSDTPQDTPASTRDNTPDPEPTVESEAAAGKKIGATNMKGSATEQSRDGGCDDGTSQIVQPAAAGEAPQDTAAQHTEKACLKAIGQLSIDEPAAKKEDQTPTLPPADSVMPEVKQTTTATSFGPLHHLEAYMLRPYMDSFGDSIIWTTKTEFLHLDEATMQAHLSKAGPDSSVVHAIATLLPEQVRLIQKHIKSRNGRLVSVQQGAPVDMVTQMGTFKIKSVVFVITIATLPNNKDNMKRTESVFAKAQEKTKQSDADVKSTLFGLNFPSSNWTAPYNNGLFSGAPVKKADTQRFRSILQPKQEPSNTTNPFQTNCPVSATPFGALQSQGQDGFIPYVEVFTSGTDLYQSITFQYDWRNLSFEELRVADYAADPTEPTKLRPASRFSDNMPGGQYVKPVSGFGSQPAQPAQSGTSRGLFRGGLFGGTPSGRGAFGQPAPPGQPTGALFGPPATGGLFSGLGTSNNTGGGGGGFGQPTASTSSGSLFGGNSKPSSGSLFGQHTKPTSTDQFGQPVAPSSGHGLFGPPPHYSSGSLFGGSAASTSGGSVFGQPSKPTSTGLFGTPDGLFNQSKATATQATPQPTGGLFGAVPAASSTGGFGPTGGFRAAPTASVSAQGGLFSSWTASSSTTGGFEATSAATTTGFFGSTPRSDGVSGLGTQKPTLSSFCAAPEPSKTAAQPTGGLFGSASQPDPFVALRNTTPATRDNPFGGFGAPKYNNIALAESKPPSRYYTSKANQPQFMCEACSAPLVLFSEPGPLCVKCEAKKKMSCWLCDTKVPGGAVKYGEKNQEETETFAVPKQPAFPAPATTAAVPTQTFTSAPAKPTTTEPEKKRNTRFFANTNGTIWSQLAPEPSVPRMPSNNLFAGFSANAPALVPLTGLFAGFGKNAPALAPASAPAFSANPFANFAPTSGVPDASANLPFGVAPGAFQERQKEEKCEHEIVFGGMCSRCRKDVKG